MATQAPFALPAGTMRAASRRTVGNIQRRRILPMLMDTSLSPELATQSEVYVQKRTYDDAAVRTIKRTKSATDNTAPPFNTPRTYTGSEIKVGWDALSYDESISIPRRDFEQSPLNELENARRQLERIIGEQWETDLLAYMNGLAKTGAGTVNGGAGPITEVSIGAAGTNYLDSDGVPKGSAADPDMMFDIIDDFVLKMKDRNLIDGTATYGTYLARVWFIMQGAPLLRSVIRRANSKGFLYTDLTRDSLRRGSLFRGNAFEAQLGVSNLIITSPNVLPSITSGNNSDPWVMYGGFTEALVADTKDGLSEVLPPGVGESGTDGYLVHMVVDKYKQLLDPNGIVRYAVVSDTSA